jgi:hypothetical protein
MRRGLRQSCILAEPISPGVAEVMDKFEELRSNFCTLRKQFAEAQTLEERQQLVAMSQQIIQAAHGEIEEFRLRYLLRRTG